jgi:hypothetical protein
MNVINLHACTMVLIGILMLTTIISLISSAPLFPYEKREFSDRRPRIFLLPDRAMPELEVCSLLTRQTIHDDRCQANGIRPVS